MGLLGSVTKRPLRATRAGLLTASLVLGCAPARVPPRPEPAAARSTDAGPSESFVFDSAQRAAIAERPDLAERVRSSAYTYFRLLADPFTERACREFSDVLDELQTVNLHGDAHLEQYAVMPQSFGLTDFDRSGFGAAVVDWVRFAASVHVACSGAAYPCDPERAVGAFLDAYRLGVAEPEAPATAPAVVERLRAAAPRDRLAFLDWASRLMIPNDDPDIERRVAARFRELEGVLSTTLGTDASNLRIVSYGAFGLGVGSALDQKVLFRVRGPSDAPEDDLVLEWQNVHIADASCVYRGPTGAMFVHLLPAARIARERPAILAYVPRSAISRSGRHWWVRSWDVGYHELSIEDIRDQAELEEVARDIGLQLGQGHCAEIADPLGPQFRYAHLRSFDKLRSRIALTARNAAEDVLEAWRRYR